MKNSINNGPVLVRGVNAQCAHFVHNSRAQSIIKLTIMKRRKKRTMKRKRAREKHMHTHTHTKQATACEEVQVLLFAYECQFENSQSRR